MANRVLIDDPAKILKMNKEELVEWYEAGTLFQEELEAQQKAIRDVLSDKIKTNGEVIGAYSVVKAKRINFKVDLEKAKELSAVKPAIDNSVLKDLLDKGVKIPHSITEYLLIRPVVKKEKK